MCLGDHVSQNALRALGTTVPRIPLASAHNSQEAVPQQTPKPLGDPAGKLGLSARFCIGSTRHTSRAPVTSLRSGLAAAKSLCLASLGMDTQEGSASPCLVGAPPPPPRPMALLHVLWPNPLSTSLAVWPGPFCLSAQLQLDGASVHAPGLRPAGNTPLSPEPLPVNPKCVLEPRSYRVLPNEQVTGIAQSEGRLWHGEALTHSLGHTEPRDPAADPGLPGLPPCPSVRVSRQGA